MPERPFSACADSRSIAGPTLLGPAWRTSSYSNPEACVQVALRNRAALVRDSKNPDGSLLRLSTYEWVAFVAEVRTEPRWDRAASQDDPPPA